MHIDETLSPVIPPRPVDAQSTPPSVLLGRTLDKSVESQRRRLLAVAIPKTLTREDIAQADDALEQLSLAFFSVPNDSLANAFGNALRAATRPSKATLVDNTAKRFDGGIVAAALDGQRLVISAAEPGLVIVQQGEQRFSFPRAKSAGDEFLDPAATIFETRLDPGDIVALLSGGVVDDRASVDRLTRMDVAKIAGADGAWVWLELEAAKKHDLRYRAGLLSEPEPSFRRTSSVTAGPAEPLWTKNGATDLAVFQKPPALDSLRRYRNASGSSISRDARTRLPRGRPSILVTGLLLLALLIAGGGLGYLYANRPQGPALPDPEIPQHTAALAAAISANDPAAVEAALPAAERALLIGQRSNLPENELAVLQNEIMQAQDSLDGVVRLSNITKIGRLPDSMVDRDPRLAESAGVLYLLAPGPFQLDADQMILLGVPFAAGSPIRTFETQVAASDAAGILASDGSRLVSMDFDGNATEIGVTTWPRGVDPTAGLVASFQNRLYLFDQLTGEIWVADSQDNEAYRWLADSEPPLPDGAVGLTIDGAIHLVYTDGRIVNMSGGVVYSRSNLGANSENFEVLAVDGGDETGNLYLVTSDEGNISLRIVDLGAERTTQVLLPPMTIGDMTLEDIFSDEHSFIVSEARGQVFWIADNELWRATLPDISNAEKPE